MTFEQDHVALPLRTHPLEMRKPEGYLPAASLVTPNMATAATPSSTDINTWTEQSLSSLSTLAIPTATTISDRSIPCGTSVMLDIPLDLDLEQPGKSDDGPEPNADPSPTP